MARRLSIAVHTVKSHVHNVLLKLGAGTRLEVAVMMHAGERSLRLAEVTRPEVAEVA
jgi:DNA-binding NarL/FixJ family response regulator